MAIKKAVKIAKYSPGGDRTEGIIPPGRANKGDAYAREAKLYGLKAKTGPVSNFGPGGYNKLNPKPKKLFKVYNNLREKKKK